MARQSETTKKSNSSSNGICRFFLRLIGRKKKPKNKSKQLLVTDVTVDDDDVISIKRTTNFERSKSSRWKSSWKRQSLRKSYREKIRLNDDDDDAEKSIEVNHTSMNDESSKTSSADESLHQNEDSKCYKSERTSNRYDAKRKSATLSSGRPRHAIADRGGGAHFIRSSAGYVSFHAPKSYNYRPHFRPNSSLITDGRTLPSNHHQTLDQLQRCLSAGNVMQDSEEENLRDSVTMLRRRPFMSSNVNNTPAPPPHKQSTIKCASSVIDLTSQSNAVRKEELRRKLIELVNSAPSFQEKQQQTANQMLIKKRAPIVDNAETTNYVFLSPIEEITSQALHNQQSLSRSTPSVNMNGENPVRPNQQYTNSVQPSDNNAHRIRALQQQQAAAADSNNRSRSRTRNISRRFTQSGALSSSCLAQLMPSHTYSTDDIQQLYADQMNYLSPQPCHNHHRTAASAQSSNNDDYVYLTRAPPVGSAEPHIPPQGARHRASSSRPKSCYDRFNHPRASTDDLSSSSPAESLNQKKRNRNVVHTSRSGDYYHLDLIVSKPKSSGRSGSRRRMSMSKRSERSDVSVAGSDRTQIYYSLDV